MLGSVNRGRRAFELLGALSALAFSTLVAGGAAGATTAPSGQMTISPTTNLMQGAVVSFHSSDGQLQPNAAGAFLECNAETSYEGAVQPTATFYLNGQSLGQFPVSCFLLAAQSTSPQGSIKATLPVATGTPAVNDPLCHEPVSGDCTGFSPQDSAGTNTKTDAESWPCPVKNDDALNGQGCSLLFVDTAGDYISQPIQLCDPMSLSGTLPTGTVGAPYQGQLTMTDEMGRMMWRCPTCSPGSTDPALTAAVAPGLHLHRYSGEISGVPTEVGTFDFTLTVVDGSHPHQTLVARTDIEVLPASPTVTLDVKGRSVTPGDPPAIASSGTLMVTAQVQDWSKVPDTGGVTFTAGGAPLPCAGAPSAGLPSRTSHDIAICVTSPADLPGPGEVALGAAVAADPNYEAAAGSLTVQATG